MERFAWLRNLRLPPRNLEQQFALASLVVLTGGMLVIGWWINHQIRASVFRQSAEITSAYLENGLLALLTDHVQGRVLTPEDIAQLDRFFSQNVLGARIASVKIWAPNGHVVYSSNPELIGRVFPIRDELRRAISGSVVVNITALDDVEHRTESWEWESLLEIYAPIRPSNDHPPLAVAEVYLPTTALDEEIRLAQKRTWVIVGASTFLMYVLLNTIMHRGQRIIQQQEQTLRSQVQSLQQLLQQNRELHSRVQRAARRTTELNERYLRRISAELHDGPVQVLALATLQLDSVREALDAQSDPVVIQTLDNTQAALQEALREMRTIATGLRLPELASLTLFEAVARAIAAHERRTQIQVDFQAGDLPDEAPLEIKIALYRITEEALNNAYKHAGGKDQRVRLELCTEAEDQQVILLEVSDSGPGFEQDSADNSARHLGLIGMRDRAESLGGTFEVHSAPGQGATIRVCLPLEHIEVIA